MKTEMQKQAESYHILFNAITDAQRLIKQGSVEVAQTLLVKAQQESEEVLINPNKNEGGIEIKREEVRDLLMYVLLTHECRDSKIRDSILDKYEEQPYYEQAVEVFNQVSEVYFKIGFDICSMITNPSTTS